MSMPSRDLFDDSTMSFGEHLEALRMHLWKAILGIAVCVIVALFQGHNIIAVMRAPIDAALREYGSEIELQEDVSEDFNFWEWLKEQFGWTELDPEQESTPQEELTDPETLKRVQVRLNAYELADQLHKTDPDHYLEPKENLIDRQLTLTLESPFFAELRGALEQMHRPVTLNVQEAFMTYLKVSMIAGLVLSSPWVFYQIWLFVAAGLYKHERKFVYIYGVLSLLLFLAGVVFCFNLVFPFVLKFLLGFNRLLKLEPQIRLSEWINFAILLPLMFGISFQLPLVMKFLQSISLFGVESYRDKRRMAILVIAALSMFLTPADPMSMILMMCPLIILYEFGILLCNFSSSPNPFADAV